MTGSHRRNPALFLLLAFAVALVAATTAADARDAGSSDTASVRIQDDGPRNAAAEAATGDTDAMLAIVQDIVDCLRAEGLRPGDARVDGHNVVIADWNPALDSAAGRATRECSFPAR
jgi:hypothetical protein